MAELSQAQKRAIAIAKAKVVAQGKSEQPAQRNPDGTYGQPPEGMFVNPETGQMTSRELLRNNVDTSTFGAASGGYMQGASFGTTDELMGAAGYLEGGPEMARLRTEQARAAFEAEREDRPGAFMAGEVTGAIASPANRVMGPANTVRGAAAQGAVSSAAYTAGNTEGGVLERAEEGAKAAPLGALFGAGAKKTIDVGTKGFRRLFNRTAERPTLSGLRTTKNEAYKAVDNAGEVFQPSELQTLSQRARQAVDDFDFVPETDLQTKAALDILERRSGQPLTLGQLDRIRQNLWKRHSSAPNEAGILAVIDEIDGLIQNRQSTSELMTAARAANSRYKKAELLDLAFQKAEDQTASTGSGGNILNKYRQAVTSIINNPRKSKWFTEEEIGVMRDFVQGSTAENVLRRIGKVSPGGNGLMMALNLGAVAAEPSMLGVTAAGAAAKAAADRSSSAGRQRVLDTVTGYQPPANPSSPPQVNTLMGLMADRVQ